jgi:hypothetical protein
MQVYGSHQRVDYKTNNAEKWVDVDNQAINLNITNYS